MLPLQLLPCRTTEGHASDLLNAEWLVLHKFLPTPLCSGDQRRPRGRAACHKKLRKLTVDVSAHIVKLTQARGQFIILKSPLQALSSQTAKVGAVGVAVERSACSRLHEPWKLSRSLLQTPCTAARSTVTAAQGGCHTAKLLVYRLPDLNRGLISGQRRGTESKHDMRTSVQDDGG